MRLQENNQHDSAEKQTAGEEFVKRIGLLGAVLFLLLSIIATIMMFTVNINPTEPNDPPEPEARTTPDFYISIFTGRA